MAARRAAVAGRDAHPVDARHQAQRGRAGPHQRAVRAPRGVGARGGALGGAQQAAQTGRLAGPQRRVPALPDPRRRLADRAGPGRRVHGEGGQGGQGAHVLDRPERGLRRRPVRVRQRRPRRPGVRRRPGRLPGGPPVVERGRVNSLAQTALLLTCPGVPDLYQGTELWDLSLVDPDNRRPVDYALRRSLLERAGGRRPGGGAGPRRRRRPEAVADPPPARGTGAGTPGPTATDPGTSRSAGTGPGRGTRWRSPAPAGWPWSCPGCSPARTARTAGRRVAGHHGGASRRPVGATCSPATRSRAAASAYPRCSGGFPWPYWADTSDAHEFRVWAPGHTSVDVVIGAGRCR